MRVDVNRRYAHMDISLGRAAGSCSRPLLSSDRVNESFILPCEIDEVVSASLWTCVLSAISGTVLGLWYDSSLSWPLYIRAALCVLTCGWMGLTIVNDPVIHLQWAQGSAWIMSVLFWTLSYMPTLPILSAALSLLALLSTMSGLGFAVAFRFDRANRRQRDVLQSQHYYQFHQHIAEEAKRRDMVLRAVSHELQNAALMVIHTLEQFSPASILASSQELLSACSIAVPIASISAINTTIKQAHYTSSHLSLISRLLDRSSTKHAKQSKIRKEFDVGDILQSTGDALAGMAAKRHILLVIYHADNGLHYTNVLGDEDALRHAMLNLLRNILLGCNEGSCIEIGLTVKTLRKHQQSILFDVICTHPESVMQKQADIPNLRTTVQLLEYTGASFTASSLDVKRRQFYVQLKLDQRRGDAVVPHANDPQRSTQFSHEPTMKELTSFIENLKGLKMVLHADEQSVFAKHLTSCLASWNTDISHVPVARPLSDHGESSSESSTPRLGEDLLVGSPRSSNHNSSNGNNASSVLSPATKEEHLHSIPPAFILIDDDITTLETKLREFRAQPPASANTLQTHQHIRRHKRTKSPSTPGPYQNFFHHGTTAIIYFTSPACYKRVRNTIQLFASTINQPFAMPRVVVVPKPAGPRRFLTALHTVWSDAIVAPHFLPIATSPSSPIPSGASSILSLMQHASSSSSSPSSTPASDPQPSSDGDRRPPNTRRTGSDNYFGGAYDVACNNASSDLASTKMTSTRRWTRPEAATDTHTGHNTSPGSNGLSKTDMASPVDTELPSASTETKGADETKEIPPKVSPQNILIGLPKPKKKKKPVVHTACPPINVLIVEDNLINCAILSNWMKKHDINYSVAYNGKEAVEKWKRGGFHLILMDIQLPVMDGLDATRTIRAMEKDQEHGILTRSSSFLSKTPLTPPSPNHEPSAPIAQTDRKEGHRAEPGGKKEHRRRHKGTTNTSPGGSSGSASTSGSVSGSDTTSVLRFPVIIVALTASSLESDRHAALATGCNDFITKPVSLEWLETKIREWGCMQALIDFEGWRQWKRSAAPTLNKASTITPLAAASSASPLPSPVTTPVPRSNLVFSLPDREDRRVILRGFSAAERRRHGTGTNGTVKSPTTTTITSPSGSTFKNKTRRHRSRRREEESRKERIA